MMIEVNAPLFVAVIVNAVTAASIVIANKVNVQSLKERIAKLEKSDSKRGDEITRIRIKIGE